MQICGACETQLDSGDQFCRTCGAFQSSTDSPHDQYSFRQGSPVVTSAVPVLPESFCMNCGRDLPETAMFCDACGMERTDFYGLSRSRSISQYLRHQLIRWDSVPEKPDLDPADLLTHDVSNAFLLRKQYISQGWNTTVVLQDVTHDGPTTAMAVGYPADWPNAIDELAKWGSQVILRLHVDVCKLGGKLVSQPHIEPDPEYNVKEHLDMWRDKNEIRGPTAVQILREFFQN